MGCDIHTFIETKTDKGWEKVYNEEDILGWRSYTMFGFLANIRNWSCIPYISEPRGLPNDSNPLNEISYHNISYKEDLKKNYGYHSFSYLTLKELLDYNYDVEFEDRRCANKILPKGEGKITTIREALGESFFKELDKLKGFGNPEKVRIVFYFDN